MREKLAIGILVGMGIMLVILGFFGWFHTNYCIEKLSYVFEYVGIDASRHYLISDLNQLMQIYVVFIVIGFMCLLAGGSLETRVKRRKKELTVKKALAIVVLTAIGTVALTALYWIIIFFSLPFTGNATVSLVLFLSITLGIPLVLFATFKIEKKERNF